MSEIDDWLTQVYTDCAREPGKPRETLYIGAQAVGSIENAIAGRLVDSGFVLPGPRSVMLAPDDATPMLRQMALWLQAHGLASQWRDELLPVKDEDGVIRAAVERGVVRTLGVTTFAVHMVGMLSDGRTWLQRRAMTKANDPGKLDTLAGGLVAFGETLDEALVRETHEEAGLSSEQARVAKYGGMLKVCCPIDEVIGGYMVEECHWYKAMLDEGVKPANLDGEVSDFVLLSPQEVVDQMLAGGVTAEAALVLAQALGVGCRRYGLR